MAKRTRPHEDQLAFDLRVKYCSRCEQERAASEFASNKRSKDGLAGYCKPCYRTYWMEYYSPASRAKAKQRKQARYVVSRDEILEKKRAWRRANLEKVRAAEKRSRLAHLESRKAALRAWNKANPEAKLAARNRRRSRKADAVTVYFTSDMLAQRWAYYANKCWVCGRPATETDHVKPISKGGAHMLCNLRPICKPCNSSKRDKWPYSPMERISA